MFRNIQTAFALLLIASCHSRTPQVKTTVTVADPYSEARHLMNERMKWSKTDTAKSTAFNIKAIEKFTLAYRMDTTNRDAAMFASECCMYGRLYRPCIAWLQILLNKDSAQSEIADHSAMLGYCYAGLGELNRSYPYFNRSIAYWRKNKPLNLSLIPANLVKISSEIFETKSPFITSIGMKPCLYSIEILEYADSLDKKNNYRLMVSERKKQCR